MAAELVHRLKGAAVKAIFNRPLCHSFPHQTGTHSGARWPQISHGGTRGWIIASRRESWFTLLVLPASWS